MELAALDERYWQPFLDAPSLSFSDSAAAPFANLMIAFRQQAGDVLFTRMCDMAYQAWERWNYRDPEHHAFIASPVACAFDYPVAVHYACMDDGDLLAEEMRLATAIDSIEERWFDSSSALCDERYRLMSRLRLVQHGMSLKSGSREALPPKITQDSRNYYKARFAFRERSF